MNTADRIRTARLACNLTQTELASRLGISKQLMYKYENGIVKNIPLDTIKEIAQILNVSPGYLADFEDTNETQIPEGFIPLPKTYKVPLVGNIACGVPILAEENIEGAVEVPDNIRADFALRCKGDSMIGVGIRDEDIVYIRKTDELPRNGQIVAVRIEDEATLKRFYLDGSDMRLVAENPSVPTLYYSGSQLELVSVEGIAVGYTHKIKE